jgi:hypothetical protein
VTPDLQALRDFPALLDEKAKTDDLDIPVSIIYRTRRIAFATCCKNRGFRKPRYSW